MKNILMVMLIICSLSFLLNAGALFILFRDLYSQSAIKEKLTLINQILETQSQFNSYEQKNRMVFEEKILTMFNDIKDLQAEALHINESLSDVLESMNEHINELDKHQIDIHSLVEERFSQVYEEHRYCREELTKISKSITTTSE